MNDNPRGLSRDAIKYIAMLTMLLNHIANVFLMRGALLTECLKAIGYFTAPVMIYFLVEGFYYTRSRKKYLIRLIIFALISQFPFSYAFSTKGNLRLVAFNMIATITLCFLILVVLDTTMMKRTKYLLIAVLYFASLWCDWAGLAAMMTILFYRARGSREKLQKAYLITLIVFFFFSYSGYLSRYAIGKSILFSVIDCTGVALAAAAILYGYNGERAKHGRTLSKWFFYLFYPAHLLILGLLKNFIF